MHSSKRAKELVVKLVALVPKSGNLFNVSWNSLKDHDITCRRQTKLKRNGGYELQQETDTG